MEAKEANEKIISRKLLLWITIAIAVCLAFLSLLSIYFVFIYPENQASQLGITNVTEKANLINQTRTTFISFFVLFAQILGGGAVAIGIYIGWGNLKVALATLESNQTKAREELKLAQDTLIADQNKSRDELKLARDTLEANMKIAQENLKIAQEGQITERFTRAVDQLGAVDQFGKPAIEIRLGGIYALERIADESKKDYWPIMEILTAYIRKNSSLKAVKNITYSFLSMDIQANEITKRNVSDVDEISLDIQAILTVIKKHMFFFDSGEPIPLDLQRAYLRRADLKEAHFERFNLSEANLEGANLERAFLIGANLKDAKLNNALLVKAQLVGTNLEGANLEGANLVGADLEGANLIEANLEGAALHGANLSRTFLGGTNLSRTNLSKANLSEAEFFTIKPISEEERDSQGRTSRKGRLLMANLLGACFVDTDLRGANLTPELLSNVKVFHNVKIDDELLLKLKEKYPYLFDEPKDEH